MTMRLSHSTAVLATLVAVLVLPSVAVGRPGLEGPVSARACPVAHVRLNVTYSCAAEFTLRGTDGYQVKVSADPEGAGSSVQLSAEGSSGEVVYEGQGRVSADSIEAGFGRLGKISVRFRPSGHMRRIRVPKNCLQGRPPVVTSRLGTFTGTIRFRGERGYTHVFAHRAAGAIGDPISNVAHGLQCESHESNAERQAELESVSLEGSPPGGNLLFSALPIFGGWVKDLPGASEAGPGNYLFLASAFERKKKLTIWRFAGAGGGPEDFVFDDALSSATVSPPEPFSGSGSFRRGPHGSGRWTGDLAVALPGRGTVVLTGGKAELETVAEEIKHSEETPSGPALASASR